MTQTNNNFDFIKYHKFFFVLTLIFILLSFYSFIFNKLNVGLDFTGGILFDININSSLNNKEKILYDNLKDNNYKNFTIEEPRNDNFIIKFSQKNNDNQEEITKNIKEIIDNSFKEITYNKVNYVGPQMGKELILKSLYGLLLSFVAMLIYISIRFELKYGIGVIISLFHNLIILFGIYSLFKINFDLLAVSAILTIIGYSINDTVVIYDRIKEISLKYHNKNIINKNNTNNLKEILNISLNTTLRRTLLTSSTTLISLLILSIFGGDVLKTFSLIVFLGILISTYSSIFIATPILMYIKTK